MYTINLIVCVFCEWESVLITQLDLSCSGTSTLAKTCLNLTQSLDSDSRQCRIIRLVKLDLGLVKNKFLAEASEDHL